MTANSSPNQIYFNHLTKKKIKCVSKSGAYNESDKDNLTSGKLDGSSYVDVAANEACGDLNSEDKAQDNVGNDDGNSDDDLYTNIKVVLKSTELPTKPPPQPKLHRFTQVRELLKIKSLNLFESG